MYYNLNITIAEYNIDKLSGFEHLNLNITIAEYNVDKLSRFGK